MINNKRQRALNPLPFIFCLYVILPIAFISLRESYLQVIFPTVILQSALRYSQCSLLVQSEQRPVPSY